MPKPLQAVPLRRLPNEHATLGYLRRRRVVGASLTLATARQACAQIPWPSQPIRLLVGFPRGGPADIPARVLARAIGETLGQPIVVENQSGAGGAIAVEAVAHAPADGHTLLMLPSGALLLPLLRRGLSFDPFVDFQPIAMVAEAPPVLCVPKTLRVRNVESFVRLLNQSSHEIVYAQSGPGTSSQLNFALLMRATGTQSIAVGYRGDPDMLQDVLADRVQATFLSVQTVAAHIRGGALVGLGVAGANRSTALPDVPSMAEVGFPSVAYVPWWGITAPRGTPSPVRDRLAEVVRKVVTSTAFRDRLGALGAQPRDRGPKEFAALVAAERERLAAIAAAAGLEQE